MADTKDKKQLMGSEKMITNFKKQFIPMIKELKAFEKENGLLISFMGDQSGVRDAFRNPKSFGKAITTSSDVEEKLKKDFIRTVRGWLYRIWVMKELSEALEVTGFKWHRYKHQLYWWVEDNSPNSTAIGESTGGDLSFWLRFTPPKGSHYIDTFAKANIPIRPDIMAVAGGYQKSREFTETGNPVDILIVTRDAAFNKWKDDIEKEFIPYKEGFKPILFVVASQGAVPKDVTTDLKKKGIYVADDLRPGGKGVKALKKLIKKARKGKV